MGFVVNVAPEPRVVSIGSLGVHDVTPAESDALIRGWLAQSERTSRYVSTPNADHTVKARHDAAFREAVNGAHLRVPDGMWIVYASRIAGRPLRATVTGRLLVPRLAAVSRDLGLPVGILGAGPGVAELAADELRRTTPGVIVTHAITPPAQFVVGSEADMEIVRHLKASPPAILFVALGAPKQELWMARHYDAVAGCTMIGVGAGIDFIAGQFKIAPPWMTRVGLEWAFRLAQEPRRLVRRYLVDDPWIIWWAARTRITTRG
jgi:N-acetylglucosaminyldiphosphoundecaprenol N-acetyl-beta-D-mannosaminyltransferase